MLPVQLGDMDQAIHPAQVHKGTKAHQVGHSTGMHIAFGQFFEYLLSSSAICLAFRQDQPSATLVHLEYDNVQGLPYQFGLGLAQLILA